MPVSRDDAARRRLFMTLRQAALPASLAATVSLGSYVILSTLMLMYVMLGLFLRPSLAISASPPALIVTPLTVDFGKVLVGDKPPQSRILTVNNRSSSLLHWIADTTKASWLKLDTNSGDIGPHMQKLVKATMDISGLSPRSVPYSTIISFHANSISTLVQMRVTVLAPGKLCIRPDHLNFGSLEQGTTGRLHVTVGNCGAQPLSWSIATGKERWVSTCTDHGTIDPEMQQDIQVTVDTSQLTPSSMAYSASLTFSSVQGSQIVPITVTVTSQVSIPQQAPGWSITPTSLTRTTLNACWVAITHGRVR